MSKLSAGQAIRFAKDILNAAKHYSEFANPTTVPKPIWGKEVSRYLQRLDIYNAKIVRSLLLSCAKYRKKDMLLVVKACETLTIRHSIISGRRSNELEKAYATIARELHDSEIDIWTLLSEQLTPYAQTDRQVQENFVLYSSERVSKKWRTVLICLNEYISTGETSVNDSREVEIEHILPQKPSKRVIKEVGLDLKELSEYARKIGNLTLLSEKLNRSASNSPFSEKRRALCKSEIALNKEICEWDSSIWGAEEIETRSRLLAERATLVWQWPPRKSEAKE
ncbi:MAG: HNH endonuclease family protein [Trueperaceae bacterium]|nr:HNH endonuclease family protein [Trueperaceae bacterium]